MLLTRLHWRLYQNFLMPDRLSEYQDLLVDAKERGYSFLTMIQLAAIANGFMTPPPLGFILRNDVDSDLSTAREMFETERRLGIRATYYFRLSTFHAGLMHEMQNHGTEIGYHFEEVATIAKRLGLRNPADVRSHLQSIQSEFRQNLQRYKKLSGGFPKTVASHGDFANRELGITNSFIIDERIRKEFSIIADVYDEWLNAPVTLRLSDADAPRWWSPKPAPEALAEKPTCVYVLVHPRQWRANPLENIKADATRTIDGARFLLARINNRLRARPPRLTRQL